MKNTKTKKEILKRRRRVKKIRAFVFNTIVMVLFAIGSFFFINSFLDAWVDEIDSHGEYNRSYQQECEMERMKNLD